MWPSAARSLRGRTDRRATARGAYSIGQRGSIGTRQSRHTNCHATRRSSLVGAVTIFRGCTVLADPHHREARSHPQLLHRRAHRPRQVDARRPADRGDGHAAEARDEGAGARHAGPRARARHHDQAQRRAHDLHARRTAGRTSSTSSTRRGTSTSPTKSRARSRRARARSSSSTRRRASRRRRCRICSSRWMPGSRSSRSSTRSTCRAPSRSGASRRCTTCSASMPTTSCS